MTMLDRKKKAWLDTKETREFLAQRVEPDHSLKPTDTTRLIMDIRKKFERLKLRDIFRHWDTDKSGFIEMQEVRSTV